MVMFRPILTNFRSIIVVNKGSDSYRHNNTPTFPHVLLYCITILLLVLPHSREWVVLQNVFGFLKPYYTYNNSVDDVCSKHISVDSGTYWILMEWCNNNMNGSKLCQSWTRWITWNIWRKISSTSNSKGT